MYDSECLTIEAVKASIDYDLGCHDARLADDKESLLQTAMEIPIDGEYPRFKLDNYWLGVYDTLRHV